MKKALFILLFSSQILSSQILDTTFGGTGTSLINTTNEYDMANNFFVNPDNSITVLGSLGLGQGGIGVNTTRVLLKVSENGTMDTSFSTGGSSPTQIMVRLDNILRLSNGKFLVFGRNFVMNIQRFSENGILDTSFGDAGTLVYDSIHYVYDGVELANGQVMIAGSAVDSDGKIRTVLTRINTDGTVDTSFGTNGKLFIRLNTVDNGSEPYNIFLSDNKLILAGILGMPSGSPTSSKGIYVARLNLDGTFDSSFGTNGKMTRMFTDTTTLVQSAKDDSGNIYLGAWCVSATNSATTSTRIIKVNSNGALDNSFGNGGIATYTFLNLPGDEDEMIKSIAVGSNGIYVGGVFFETSFYYPQYASGFLSKFNLDGTPDLSFGNNGFHNFFAPGQMFRRVAKIGFDHNKRLIVAGDSKGTDRSFAFVRFNIVNETLNVHDDERSFDDIKIYPNPTTDFIRIEGSEISGKNLEFKIYDISGRIMKSGNAKVSEPIYLQDLEKGNYIVQIKTNKGETFSSKIIRQ